MKRQYTPRRVDGNHAEVVEALRSIGASVLDIHDLGHGAPDLLVGFRAENFLLEVKDGSKPPSHRKLTKDERDFFDAWRGPIYVVLSPEDAVSVVNHITAESEV